MNNEIITMNEVQNDGKSIHLYFDGLIGLYVAYGFSAFFVTHFVNATSSFSDDLQMPVALLRKDQVTELKGSVKKLQHEHHVYYLLELKRPIELDGYTRWANEVKWDNQDK